MPVNSRAKGKRGELEAVKYLKSLGFEDAKRTQQYNGLGRGDVECLGLNVHIEVKFCVKGMDLGTQLFRDACEQAARDAAGREWVVLWKRAGSHQWRLSIPQQVIKAGLKCDRRVVTYGDDDAIRSVLESTFDVNLVPHPTGFPCN